MGQNVSHRLVVFGESVINLTISQYSVVHFQYLGLTLWVWVVSTEVL
jgi:hypothetical protein